MNYRVFLYCRSGDEMSADATGMIQALEDAAAAGANVIGTQMTIQSMRPFATLRMQALSLSFLRETI